MIKNERQYRSAKTQIDVTRRNLANARGKDKVSRKWIEDSHHALLEELERDVADYEALKTGRVALEGRRMGELLIKARIARGWTQQQLADRLGLHIQAVADYEAREYARASLTRIEQVLQALGALPRLALDLVDAPEDLEVQTARDAEPVTGRRAIRLHEDDGGDVRQATPAPRRRIVLGDSVKAKPINRLR